MSIEGILNQNPGASRKENTRMKTTRRFLSLLVLAVALSSLERSASATAPTPNVTPETNARWDWNNRSRVLLHGVDSADPTNSSLPLQVDKSSRGLRTDPRISQTYQITTTLLVITAAQLLDNKIVMGWTAMNIDPTKVTQIDFFSDDGSATNSALMGFSASVNGQGAAIGAFTGRARIYGGLPTSATSLNGNVQVNAIPPFGRSFSTGLIYDATKFGTIYVATADVLATGIQNIRAVIYTRK